MLCCEVVEVMSVLDYVGHTLIFCDRSVKTIWLVASWSLWFFCDRLAWSIYSIGDRSLVLHMTFRQLPHSL